MNHSFSNDDVRSAWNTAARAWNTFVHQADYYRRDVHDPALLAACEPLQNHYVLELGCGQGYFCRMLADQEAKVVGIDLAEQQIAYAQIHEAQQPIGIEYHVMPAQQVDRHWLAAFDLVTGCMSLHDMADVAASLKSAFAVLKPGGRMVFSVPHPCTDTPFRQWERGEQGEKSALQIDRYFESGAAVVNWNMKRLEYSWQTPYWRYTLSEWTNLIAEAGFLMRRLHEPRPTPQQVDRNLDLDDCYRLPYFLVFDLIKPDRPSL